jgi:hypothetical protein
LLSIRAVEAAAARPPGFDYYRSPVTFARLAKVGLALSMLSLIFAGIAEADQYSLLTDDSLATLSLDEANASDDRVALAYLVSLGALILCAGFFIAWTSRVYKNAAALGAIEQRFGPGWAVGGWFVPVLAWWRPKQIVNDVWRTSDPEAAAVLPRHQWQDVPVPAFITAWWLLWVFSGFVDRLGATFGDEDATLEQLRLSAMAGVVQAGLFVITGLLAVRVVTVLTDRQERRAERLAELPQAARLPG